MYELHISVLLNPPVLFIQSKIEHDWYFIDAELYDYKQKLLSVRSRLRVQKIQLHEYCVV